MAAQTAFRVSPAMAAALLAFFFWKRRVKDEVPTSPGVSRSNVSAVDRLSVVNAIAAQGWPPAEVDKVIRIESGWRTDAKNPVSHASGLIQNMPVWFVQQHFRDDLGTGKERAAAFRQLSALEQLPWILRYFGAVRRWRKPGDTYLAVAAPAHVGADDATIIFAVGGKAWQQNPAWRESPQGPITAGSIRRVLLRQLRGVSNA